MRSTCLTPRLDGIRTVFSPRLASVLLVALCGGGTLSSLEEAPLSCPETGCFADAAVDNTVPSADVTTPVPDAAVTQMHPFCGTGCNPDLVEACSSYAPADAGSGDSAPPGDAAGTSEAGLDGGKTAEDAASGNMGAYGASGKAPDNGDEVDENFPAYGCRVTWSASETLAACSAAGTGKDKAPCSSSADCAAGYACVGTTIAQCQKFCCVGNEACPAGAYCSEEIARDYLTDHPSANPSELRRVPVCIPARGCDPIDSTGDPNACETGLSCAIVRSDGTTGCVALPENAPGEGGSCKDVPCAQGYVCAKSTNTCLKLCHVSSSEDECAGGVCQGGSTNLPAGLGVCVGSYDE